jgi:putative transcriptional regulator
MKSNIDEYIKKSGLKKKFIAAELGVTPNQLSNWIKGRSFPQLEKAFRLADMLGCTVDDLYIRDEE